MPVKLNFSDIKTLEKYSSAVSLSDMEIFVFPELFYPLVISNIMSPVIWKWRDDPWFKGIHKKSFTYKVNRIKQFIMDHYVFNLDLETWGLTDKNKEIARFKDFIDLDTLRHSNALFGYEGDKYYFDQNIRQHFGLDKYNTDVIPYWKTETVEAMTAFRHKPGFTTGAGECVSFSALYAAALFIVGQIPLEDIYLIATPLHSQNFIDVDEGIITNNRRIVTKTMWFNGTPITSKARRALENEKVTIVSHISGYIHRVFPKATIDPALYAKFSANLKRYLKTELNSALVLNFMRNDEGFRSYFQFKFHIGGKDVFVKMESLFALENNLRTPFSKQSAESFFQAIPSHELFAQPFCGRIVWQELEHTFEQHVSADIPQKILIDLAESAQCQNLTAFKSYLDALGRFVNIKPQLPATNKEFKDYPKLEISTAQTREEIAQYIFDKARENEVASLALYTHRQMDRISWRPFMKAALERNPVSLNALKGLPVDAVYQLLFALPNESVYDSQRLAQPDETWNFHRGDGIEKAVVLANYLCNNKLYGKISLVIENEKVILKAGVKQFVFFSSKGIVKELDCPTAYRSCFCKCG